MTEPWQRRVLFLAAAWNIVGGASALFSPANHFAQLYTRALSLDDPVQLFFYRCTWINVIAWGIAYLLAALIPVARRVVLVAGGLGKLVYFLACVSLYSSGAGTSGLLAAGVVDLCFAILFAVVAFPRRRPAGS
jgi:hypothetical protein